MLILLVIKAEVATGSSDPSRLLANKFWQLISDVNRLLRASLTLASPVRYFSVAVGINELCDYYFYSKSGFFGFLKLY